MPKNPFLSLEYIAPPLQPKMRPGEKVRAFIFQQAKVSTSPNAWRLPSMRQMASHLGVSMTAVQRVYRDLTNEGYIFADANRGTFFNPRQADSLSQSYYIGLDFIDNMESPNTSWASSINAGILEIALRLHGRLKFSRFSPDEKGIGNVRRAKKEGKLNGMILLSGESSLPMEKLCQNMGIPVVHLLPPVNNSTTNFVGPDSFNASRTLAKSLLRAGRKRIAFVEGIMSDYMSCNGPLLFGLIEGLREETEGLSNLMHFVAHKKDHTAVFHRILQSAKRPDAIFCAGDYLAIEAIKVARSLDIKIPSELSIIGSSGLLWMHTEFTSMTRIMQPFLKIGEALVDMIEVLISNPNQAVPGKHLPCSFGGGSTTTREENRLLGIKGL